MDILHTLSPLDWLRLAVALLLYIGPGYALSRLYRPQQPLDKTMTTALASALALAFWTVLLAWLQALNIRVTFLSAFFIALLGWGGAFIQWQGETVHTKIVQAARRSDKGWQRFILWLILIATAVANGYALHGVVVAPGSDGYHHTLFVELIAEQGGLLRDLLALTPVASFTYHFGFHGFVATLIWLGDFSLDRLPAVALTPLLGQLLKAVAALCTAFFAERLMQDHRAGLISAAIVGLIAVFPAYLVNWGRDTQLAGFVMVPILLALLWQWAVDQNAGWRPMGLLALLAAGIALTHYRVTIMTVIGGVLVLGINALVQRWPLHSWRVRGLQLIVFSAGLISLVAPWFWHVYQVRHTGYAVKLGDQTERVFSLARLGDNVLQYPTNLPLLLFLGIALLAGWWRRVQVVIILSSWTVLLLVLSAPRLFGLYMDTVTVFTSLYFMVAVVIGWFGAWLLTQLEVRKWDWLRWALIALFCVFMGQGGVAIATIIEPNAAYVKPEDLPAIAWIRQHTPPSAYFMVNTFHFDFWPDYVIGSDAGFWLPVLTKRRTVTAPMTYSVERNATPDYGQRIVALDRLQGDLTSATALALLKQQGVTYVYIGQRGGVIAAQALLKSPAFKLEFQHEATYVFRFLGSP